LISKHEIFQTKKAAEQAYFSVGSLLFTDSGLFNNEKYCKWLKLELAIKPLTLLRAFMSLVQSLPPGKGLDEI
jgi:hypothetical protein